MKREIKFRAWNLFEKCFYTKPFLVTCIGIPFIYNEEFLHIEDYDAVNPAMGLVIQQYTGIKDKNGKEIYEGDVVQYKVKRTDVSKVTEQLEIKTITFSNGRFSPFPEKICYPDYTDYESYDFEVIGHIFEN